MSFLTLACVVMILVTPLGVHLMGYHIGQKSNQTLHLKSVKGSLLSGFQIGEVHIKNIPVTLHNVSGNLRLFSSMPSFQARIQNIAPAAHTSLPSVLNALPPSMLHVGIDAPLWSDHPITAYATVHDTTYHVIFNTQDASLQNHKQDIHTLYLQRPTQPQDSTLLQGHFYNNKDIHTVHAQLQPNNLIDIHVAGKQHNLRSQIMLDTLSPRFSLRYTNNSNQNQITLEALADKQQVVLQNFSMQWDTLSIGTSLLNDIKVDTHAHIASQRPYAFYIKTSVKKYQNASYCIDDLQLHAQHNAKNATPFSLSALGTLNHQHHLHLSVDGTAEAQHIHLQSNDLLSKKNDTRFSFKTTQRISHNRDGAVFTYQDALLNQKPVYPSPNQSKKIEWHYQNGLTLHPMQSKEHDNISDVSGTWSRHGDIDAHIVAHNFSLAPLFHYQLIPTGPVSLTKASISGSADIKIEKHTPLRVKGAFQVNELQGAVQLNSIVSHLPHQSVLHFHEKQLSGTLDHNGMHLHGEVLTNNKDIIDVDLSVNPFHASLKDTSYNLSIQGKNTQLLRNRTSDVHADVQLSLHEKAHHLHTVGRISFKNSHYSHHKPWTSHPQLPSEAVIVQSQTHPDAPVKTPDRTYSYDITLDAAEKNTVDVLDIQAQLVGKIRLVANNETPLTQGNIELQDASFRFFGNPIPIDSLSLTWHNVPIDSPDLHIELSQALQIPSKHQKQRYGLKVTGPIQQPKIDFYSDPMEMTQYEILASILTQNHKTQNNPLDGKAHASQLFSLIEQGMTDKQNIEDSLRSLSTLKRLFIFEYIDINDKNIKPNSSSAFIHDLELTLTRKLKDNITIQLQLSPDNPDRHKLLLDAQLNNHVSLSTYVDSKGSGGVAAHFRK